MYVTEAQTFYEQLKTDKLLNLTEKLTFHQSIIIRKFCSLKVPKTIFGKIRAVKSLVKGLISAGLIPKIKVKVCLFGKGLASMTEDGKIWLYAKFLFRQPYCESVLTVLHELAHVKLWLWEDYSALKQCDGEFVQNYVKNISCTVVSPIEYYANVIAIDWLNQVISEIAEKERLNQLNVAKKRLIEKLIKAKENLFKSTGD